MSRFRLTFAVAVTLTATYQLYAQWAESFTRIESKAPSPAAVAHATVSPAPIASIAERLLPEESWLRTAGYTFQRGEELFLYANTVQPVKDASAAAAGHSAERIEMKPFVLIWIDPDQPEAVPYVVQCDAAKVQFENPVEFGFDARSPGRLKAATFDGAVRITGPDGLRIEGERFDFSDDDLTLYSPYPLNFEYGPTGTSANQVRGTASSGIQVDFQRSLDAEIGQDMPRIGGVNSVRLLNNVVLDCFYEERSKDDNEPQRQTVHVQCEASLAYDAVERKAVLLKNVLVRRPTGGTKAPEDADTLRCHQLSLWLAEAAEAPKAALEVPAEIRAVDAPAGSRLHSSLGSLRLAHVEAAGNVTAGTRATVQSDEQRTTAQFLDLQYYADTSSFVLNDPNGVLVKRDDTYLRSPTVQATAEPESQQQVLTCLGKGQLQQVDPETGKPLLDATWQKQLQAAPDPNTGLLLVHLEEDARVIVDQQAGMRADQLYLWIDNPEGDLPRTEAVGIAAPGASLAGQRPADAPFPLRYVDALGRVVMANTGGADARALSLHVETERLRAVIEPGRLPYDDDEESAPDQPVEQVADEAAAGAEPEKTQPPKPAEPWHLESREMFLRLLNPPGTRDVQIAEAIADGSVAALRTETRDDGTPVNTSLSGSQVRLINEGGEHQIVNVIGSPLLLRRGEMLLECRNLEFDRVGNRVKVVGEGLLQAPVYRDLNGTDLDHPLALDVKWAESMTFNGVQATFLKQVLLQLHDSVLQCDEMDVRLMKAIEFNGERPKSEKVEIRDVGCRNGVHVEIYDWEENRIVGIRKGDLTQFRLDYQSGVFQGDGPGKINHWARARGRRVAVAPTRAAQANTPAASDQLDWEHVSVAFDDLLTGNFKDRTAELHGRVRMIYAPVRHVSETFVRNDLSGTSPSVSHAVWLGCDVLAIEMHSRPVAQGDEHPVRDDYLVISGQGACEMEGQLFHAKADSLSYDEDKEQFTLRGKGNREASLYYERRPGDGAPRFGGQIIQFYPSQERYVLDGSSGFQAVQ